MQQKYCLGELASYNAAVVNAVPNQPIEPYQFPRNNAKESDLSRKVLTGQIGFGLFFGEYTRTTFHAPTLNFREHSHKGLRDVLLTARSEQEERIFWELLKCPPKNSAVTLQRQDTLRAMQNGVSADINGAIVSLYKFASAVELLCSGESGDSIDFALRDSTKKAKTPFERLVEAGITATNLSAKLKESEEAQRYRDPTSYDRALAALNILSISKNIPQLLRSINSQSNPHLLAICSSLGEVLNEVPIFTGIDLLNCDATQGRATLITAHTKLLNAVDRVAHFGALLTAAELAKRDSYCLATADPTKREFYKGAWNLLKERDGHSSLWSTGDNVTAQVRGDSPPPTAWLLLRAGNESGKSFFMRRDIMLRLFAQTFGFAPAAECNIHPRDSYIWLGRPGTDFQKKLSSFGLDNKQIIDALPACLGRYRLYWDEPMSTTGAMDQYCLAWGWSDYHLDRGGEIIMASHSDELAQDQITDQRCSVYHFEQRVTKEGKIDYLYTLLPGPDDSRAIELARANGFCPEIIQIAEAYLAGEVPKLILSVPEKKLVRYSEDKRRAFKEKVGDFRTLIPTCDYVESDTTGRFLWHYGGRDAEMPIRPERRHSIVGGAAVESTYVSFAGNVLSQITQLRGSLLKDLRIHQEGWEYVEDLLRFGLTSDPAELAERATTFAALMDKDFNAKLEQAIGVCWNSSYGWVSLLCEELSQEARKDFLREFIVSTCTCCRDEVEMTFMGEREDNARNIEFLDQAVRFAYRIAGIDYESSRGAAEMHILAEIIALDRKYGQALYTKFEKLPDETAEQGLKRLNEHIAARDRLILEAHKLAGLVAPSSVRSGFSTPLAVALSKVQAAASKELPKINLLDIDWRQEREALDKLYQAVIKSHFPLHSQCLRPHDVVNVMSVLTLESDPFVELARVLKGTDSIHLSQMANYFANLGAKFIGANARSEDFKRLITDQARPWQRRNSALNSYNAYLIIGELKRLSALAYLGQVMERDKFCRVNFNAGDKLEVVGAWNALGVKGEQVANTSLFKPGQIASINTGANMSGKSHDTDKTTVALLFAHTTGFAPAESMDSPVFDRIISVGRINEALDYNLSGFGNERATLNRALDLIKPGQLVFLSLDEPYSTTSFRYQGALVFGTVHLAAKRGVRVELATHAHDVVEDLTRSYPEQVASWHFLTHIDSSGMMIFDYLKHKGHGASDGIAVAEALGAPGEVIVRAKMAQKRWESRHVSSKHIFPC